MTTLAPWAPMIAPPLPARDDRLTGTCPDAYPAAACSMVVNEMGWKLPFRRDGSHFIHVTRVLCPTHGYIEPHDLADLTPREAHELACEHLAATH